MCDASKRATREVLFQLQIKGPGEIAGPSTRDDERIIMFLSFKLSSAKMKYSNSERQALAIIQNLAEIRWMVLGSPFPVQIYTDHEALKVLLDHPDNDSHGRIARWQDRLREFDFHLHHKKAKTHFMGIVDGMSRLPDQLLQRHFINLEKRL